MGRWTSDEHGCIYDEAGCFARLTPNKAERLATRHNADIDALTAERVELQRRLAEVVATDHYQRSLDEMHLRYNVEAERDELQRRLDAVVAAIPMADLESGEVFCLDCNAITEPCALPDLQGDYCSECEEQVYSPFNDEEACAIYSKLLAIAEGREG